MPRGGLRKRSEPKETEEADCKGHLSIKRPHKFTRPKGKQA